MTVKGYPTFFIGRNAWEKSKVLQILRLTEAQRKKIVCFTKRNISQILRKKSEVIKIRRSEAQKENAFFWSGQEFLSWLNFIQFRRMP